MEGTVIIADDDLSIRTVLTQAVTRAGCRVKATGALSTLWRWVEEGEGDALILDVILPDGDALDMLPALRKKRPEMPVIVVSANNTVFTTIRANQTGAYEYFPKPFEIKDILGALNKALSRDLTVIPSSDNIQQERKEVYGGSDLPLVGRSQSMQDVYRVIARLINTDLTVLLVGASGTGKELVARALHDLGNRREMPFIAINLAAMPSEQIELELFGIDPNKGSSGKFKLAEGGTLFLDEVGEMPLVAQTRLLRVLQVQDHRYSHDKGKSKTVSDVRIISSTQNDLKALISEGKFREDLFFRLNVIPVILPLLRERSEDIPELCVHFLKQCIDNGLPEKSLTSMTIDLLKRQVWRGNVRELKNFIQRLVVLSPDEIVSDDLVKDQLNLISLENGSEEIGSVEGLSASVEKHLVRYFELHENSLPPNGLYNRVLREIEYPLIALALSVAKGNQIKAARLLGINRNTLRKKISELDINVSQLKKMI
ncbi:MAG: sigma 54-interacting transcriptional regulator [Paracoccaceae bacterium]